MKVRPHLLTQMDVRSIPTGDGEIRLFLNIRNEAPRLPYFLDYYRKLGVDRFIVTDNGSTDGSIEYLLSQLDCHIFSTPDSFRAAYHGVHWQNKLLDRYGTGHWCLYLDADELLAYPHCERTNLKRLCQYLDNEGCEGLYTFMLDMYADGTMANAIYEPGKPFTDICPLFDTDYKFVRRPWIDRLELPKRPPPFPEREVIGGPRARLFYPEQNSTKVWPRLKPRLLGRVMKILAQLRLIAEEQVPHMAPILFKVPLVKWRKGLAYYATQHILTPVKLSSVTGALLHFKFFADFHSKAAIEAARGEHEGGGRQYRRYDRILREKGDAAFAYAGSARYKSSEDLLKHSLIKSNPAFDAFVAAAREHAA